jgi:hypothetical protein
MAIERDLIGPGSESFPVFFCLYRYDINIIT